MWITSKMNTRRNSRQSNGDDCILLSSDNEINLSNSRFNIDEVVDLTAPSDVSLIIVDSTISPQDSTFNIDEVVDLTAPNDVSLIIVDSTISPQVRQRHLRRRRRNPIQQHPSTRSSDPIILNAENTSTDASFSHWRLSDQYTNNEHSSNEVNSLQHISEQEPLSTLNPDASSIDNQVCPLCLETYKEIKAKGQTLVSTMCGHIFCKDCSRRCLSGRCPTCRKKLNAKSIHPLYL